MKKLLSLIVIAVLGISTSFAQTTAPASKQAAKSVKAVAPAVKKEVKKVETKTVATKIAAANNPKKAPKAAVAKATKLKADGTPDMRYAENKAKTAVAAGPKKKDGTADMRYKANKAAAAKKN